MSMSPQLIVIAKQISTTLFQLPVFPLVHFSVLFYYNYLNNPNFNNKSDKIKILRIRFFFTSQFFLKKN
jgi:hypothetical protein